MSPLSGLPEPLQQAARNIVSLITSLGLSDAILGILIKNHSNYAKIQELLKA